MKLIKHSIFIMILTGMLLPLIRQKFPGMPLRPLAGVTDTLIIPGFTFKKYMDQSFQVTTDNYVTKKNGFRPFQIRLKNQVDYSVFNYTHSGGVVIGNDGSLFLESYINNYCGIEFRGADQIDLEVKKLALVGKELKKRNVDLLLILAPGKATFNQEQIPSRYMKKPLTNYEYYSGKLAFSGLNVIDMNAWFRQLKLKTPYPLYPRNGVHWSSYAVALAADSMVKYIERLRDIDMPEIIVDRTPVSGVMNTSDYDAGELMNLLFPLENYAMPYPVLRYDTVRKLRPGVVVIADSYWWAMITSGISINIFRNPNYWFYGQAVFEEEKKTGMVSNLYVRAELEKQDIVIILLTEATWMLFPFGITDAFLKDFKPETRQEKELLVEVMMEKIRKDPAWFRSIMEKAVRNQVPVEEQIRLDALYMIDLAGK